MKIITFFNNKGGVGKTTLVYHLSWMFRERGCKVLVVDLDPQANLTSFYMAEEQEEQMREIDHHPTIYSAVKPLVEGSGDIELPEIFTADEDLGLICGDLQLSSYEDSLSSEWPKALDANIRAFRILTSFYRIIKLSAEKMNAHIVLMDIGPNLGAINRTALISSDYVITPMAPDLHSLQGLKNLGPSLRKWKANWRDRILKQPDGLDLPMPEGLMEPAGYIAMQHSAYKANRPAKAYEKWINRMPSTYHQYVLDDHKIPSSFHSDDACLAALRHYRSLMPMAHEARKPMFRLTPADGAFGAHSKSVQDCREDFYKLTDKLIQRCGVQVTI